MKSSKIITFSSFVILIIAYVAYQAGAFEKFAEQRDSTDSKLKINETIAIDSPIVNNGDDTLITSPTMMSTSKSIILIEKKYKLNPLPDNVTKKSQQENKYDSTNKISQEEINMMGSSKSRQIFRPKPVIDTTKSDIKK